MARFVRIPDLLSCNCPNGSLYALMLSPCVRGGKEVQRQGLERTVLRPEQQQAQRPFLRRRTAF